MESPIATASFPVVVANADDNADVTSPVHLSILQGEFALGSKPPPFIRAARTDLGTKLQQQMLFYLSFYLPISVPSLISSDRPIRKTISQV